MKALLLQCIPGAQSSQNTQPTPGPTTTGYHVVDGGTGGRLKSVALWLCLLLLMRMLGYYVHPNKQIHKVPKVTVSSAHSQSQMLLNQFSVYLIKAPVTSLHTAYGFGWFGWLWSPIEVIQQTIVQRTSRKLTDKHTFHFTPKERN